MAHNPALSATERVLWRTVCQAAFDAARDPAAVGKAKALKKALAGSEGWRQPDLRPLPFGLFRAFLTMARGWAPETDARLRAHLAPRLEALADAAGEVLDGLPVADDAPPAWTTRADLR